MLKKIFSNSVLQNALRLIKVNNPSVPMGVPLYPTGDKPILYSTEAVLFYLECAPVATAIDRISAEIASIKPLVYSKKDKKFIDDHPVLQLLSFPDADVTWEEFIHAVATWYQIAGNAYIKAEGYIETPPKNIRVMPSQSATIVVGIDGYAQNFTARVLGIVDTYNRTSVVNYGHERYRYYASEFKELYHIRTFNPQVSSNMAYGISPLNAVFYEMRQYIEAAKYNLSSLQRGSRLSGLFKVKRLLPPEQRQRLETQINYAIAGSNNAGRTMLLDEDAEFQDLIKNQRDMDYIQMRDQVTKSIYNALKIPLPLISEEHMTLSNLEGAKAIFYEQAVIPLAKRLFSELSNFLMPRYDNDNDDLIISFNEQDISALEPKRNDQAKVKKDIGIFTMNELRKTFAEDPLSGGQFIYGPSANVPIATDAEDVFYKPEDNTSTQNDMEITEKPEESRDEFENETPYEPDLDEDKKSREKFVTRLKIQVNKDGTRRFTDEEIEEIANQHYGYN
jgi:HK97 family phage portal protein